MKRKMFANPKLDFESEFSMSKIIRIFPSFFLSVNHRASNFYHQFFIGFPLKYTNAHSIGTQLQIGVKTFMKITQLKIFFTLPISGDWYFLISFGWILEGGTIFRK